MTPFEAFAVTYWMAVAVIATPFFLGAIYLIASGLSNPHR